MESLYGSQQHLLVVIMSPCSNQINILMHLKIYNYQLTERITKHNINIKIQKQGLFRKQEQYCSSHVAYHFY